MLDRFSVTDRSVLESIPRLMKETGSKTEVFNRLKEKLPNHQHDSLAKRIVSFTSEEIRTRNKLPVYMLITSLIMWLSLFKTSSDIKCVPDSSVFFMVQLLLPYLCNAAKQNTE